MKLSFDPQQNIAYIRIHTKTTQVETIRVSDEIHVDVAPDGTVYGIELLNANAQLRQEDGDRLLLVNEATGEHKEVTLPLS